MILVEKTWINSVKSVDLLNSSNMEKAFDNAIKLKERLRLKVMFCIFLLDLCKASSKNLWSQIVWLQHDTITDFIYSLIFKFLFHVCLYFSLKIYL